MISHCRLGHENFELLNHDVVEPLLIEGGCNTPKGGGGGGIDKGSMLILRLTFWFL